MRLFLLALLLTLAPVRAEGGACCGQGSCLTCDEACSLCPAQAIDLGPATPLVLPLRAASLALPDPVVEQVESGRAVARAATRCPLSPLTRGRAPPRAFGS